MNLVPVSRERHFGKRLRALPSYGYAAGMAATEVVIGEISQIAASYPIFFIKTEQGHKVIAMLGLSQGENLFVDSSGFWTDPYIPATLRAYPFTMARTSDAGDITVLVDEDAGLLSDHEGEPLFGTEDGDPNGPLARAIQLLTHIALEGSRTSALANQLDELGLLKPASLNVQRRGVSQDLGGVLAIDPPTLDALPDESFLALRRTGALMLAHAQLLSLAQLLRLQAKADMLDRQHSSAKPS